MNITSGLPDFLNPTKNPFPKIFPLPRHLNPFADKGVDIFPVPLYGNYIANMKTVVGFNMLEAAKRSGALTPKTHTLVEATSGNTGVGLGIAAPHYGIKRVFAVVKRDTAPGKLEQLTLLGVEYLKPDIEFNLSTVEEARRLGKRDGWLNLDQYSNDANWQAHAMWTAPHVWEGLAGKMSVFAAGLGTTGTVMGMDQFLKVLGVREKVKIIGVVLHEGSAIPGVRTDKELEQIAFDWKSSIDCRKYVTTLKSYQKSRALCCAGCMVGPSSGFVFAGLLDYLDRMQDRFDEIRNEDGRVAAAFICGDTPIPYLEKYSMALEDGELKPATISQ